MLAEAITLRLRLILLALIAGITFIMGLATQNIKIDDAYIFYSYVQNIVSGRGYVFNEGQFINGTTSALYPLLTSLAVIVLSWFPVAIDTTGHFLGFVALGLAMSFFLEAIRPTSLSAALAFPLLILSSRITYAGVGMESFVALCLVSITLALYLDNRLKSAAIAFGFAVLARPDNIIFGFVLAIDYVFRNRRLPSYQVILIALVPILPWLLFSLLYFGEIIPNTVQAKLAQSGHGYWGSGYVYLKGAKRLLNSYGPLSPYIITIAAIVAISRIKTFASNRAIFLLFCWGLLYFLVYSFIINPPPYQWYYVPLTVPIAALVSFFVATAVERAPRTTLVLFVILIGVQLIGLYSSFASTPVTAKYDTYKRAAAWFNANASAGDSVAAMEIGVLRYFYNKGPIIDGLGLTSRAAHLIAKREHDWFIHAFKPNYLLLNNPPRKILEDFVDAAWFSSQYELAETLRSPRNPKGVRIYRRVVPKL